MITGRTDVHILPGLGHHVVPARGDEQKVDGGGAVEAGRLVPAIQTGLLHTLTP